MHGKYEFSISKTTRQHNIKCANRFNEERYMVNMLVFVRRSLHEDGADSELHILHCYSLRS